MLQKAGPARRALSCRRRFARPKTPPGRKRQILVEEAQGRQHFAALSLRALPRDPSRSRFHSHQGLWAVRASSKAHSDLSRQQRAPKSPARRQILKAQRAAKLAARRADGDLRKASFAQRARPNPAAGHRERSVAARQPRCSLPGLTGQRRTVRLKRKKKARGAQSSPYLRSPELPRRRGLVRGPSCSVARGLLCKPTAKQGVQGALDGSALSR